MIHILANHFFRSLILMESQTLRFYAILCFTVPPVFIENVSNENIPKDNIGPGSIYIGGLVSSVVRLFPIEASFIRKWSGRKLIGVIFGKNTEKMGSFAKIKLP